MARKRGRRRHRPEYVEVLGRRVTRHKGTGLAYVVLGGRRCYVGPYGAPDMVARAKRLVLEGDGPGAARGPDVTVAELAIAFDERNKAHYRDADGNETSERGNHATPCRIVTELYGDLPVAEFSPRCLKAVRAALVALPASHARKRKAKAKPAGGAPGDAAGAPAPAAPEPPPRLLSRKTVNAHVSRIRAMFKWGVSEELVPAEVYHALACVGGLRKGRCEAPDLPPVRPVPEAHVDAVLPLLRRQIAAVVRLQLATGARAGELLIMRPCDLDRSGEVWVYRPARHKTEHHGHAREVLIGPEGQRALTPFLLREPGAYCFSPREAEAERLAEIHAARVTPMNEGNRPGVKTGKRASRAARVLGEHYTTASYGRAIARACADAKVPRWGPHRLRHNFATRVRREHGLDLTRVLCGHRWGSAITEVYAEADRARAAEVVARIG